MAVLPRIGGGVASLTRGWEGALWYEEGGGDNVTTRRGIHWNVSARTGSQVWTSSLLAALSRGMMTLSSLNLRRMAGGQATCVIAWLHGTSTGWQPLRIRLEADPVARHGVRLRRAHQERVVLLLEPAQPQELRPAAGDSPPPCTQ